MNECLNLKGTLSLPTEIRGSIDISQNATATAEDIRKGKTAAVKGSLIEGMLDEIDWLEESVKITPIGGATILKNTIYDKDTEVTVDMGEVEKELKPENIRAGVTVRYTPDSVTEGVDAFTGTFSQDATAGEYNVASGYTYYANGENHTGKMKTADINDMDMQLPFGTWMPTHAVDLTLHKKTGNPYLKLYKRGTVSTDYELVELGSSGYTITNIGTPFSDQIISFAITDETGASVPTTLDQAKIMVQGHYHSIINADSL